MQRREFIKTTLIGAGLVSVTGYFLYPSFEKMLEGIIKRDLNYLQIEDQVINQFITDTFKENYWERIYFKSEKELFMKAHYIAGWLPLPYKSKYQQMKDRLIGDFLLSTDFFINAADEKRTLKYIGLYNPYSRPCFHPFTGNRSEFANS